MPKNDEPCEERGKGNKFVLGKLLKKINSKFHFSQGATNAQNLQILLRKCFNLRGKIVRKLSLSQKAAFMDLMKVRGGEEIKGMKILILFLAILSKVFVAICSQMPNFRNSTKHWPNC